MFWKQSGLDVPAFGDAHLATREEMEAAGLFADKGIRLGYYRSSKARQTWGQVIRYNGDGGLILVAPPRSGKARDVLVGALLEYDQSVIVVDPKGQLAAITAAQRHRMGQRIFMLNPFNVWPEILGPTARYNPMAVLDPSSSTFAAECRKLAEGLVAKNGNERDSHWTDGARTLVSSVIGHLATDEDPAYRNLPQMREIIAGPQIVLNEFAKSALKSPHAFIRQGLAEYAIADAPNKAEIAGKISTAREQTFFLSIDTIADNIRGNDFRFSTLKNEPVTVYVILPDEHLDTCGKWFRLVVASALHDLWRGGRGAYRVLAILDEFAHIGHLDILEKAAGMAAGHGLQLWPVLQNLTQLKKDYGENWETFIAGSEIRQFFATRDQTSAKYVSETSGQRTVTTAGQSVQNTKLLEHDQSSNSAGQTGQPLIRPHEINGFGPNESLIFGPRNIVIDGLRQPYFHTLEFAGLFSPDPQHASDAAPPPPVKPESVITFADTHAAGLEKSAKALAAKRPTFVRLLTWGSSPNPTLNALRKAEYVLTLPLRLVAALLAAPFAIHNKPLGAVVGFVALFGFWEVFDGLAKGPIVELYTQKAHEYQYEELSKNGHSAGNDMYTHYRAAKWVITDVLPRAVSFAFKNNDPSYGTGIEGRIRRMSAVLDYEEGKSGVKDWKNVEGATLRVTSEQNLLHLGPGPDPTLKGLSPQDALFEKLKAQQDAAAPSAWNPLNWRRLLFAEKPGSSVIASPQLVQMTGGDFLVYTASDIPSARPNVNTGSRGKDIKATNLRSGESVMLFRNSADQLITTVIHDVEFYVGERDFGQGRNGPILIPVAAASSHLKFD